MGRPAQNPPMIDSRAVRNLVQAQAIRSATVVGQGGAWAVCVRYGTQERAIASTRGSLRTWRRLDSATAFIREELDLSHFQVDASSHDPDATGHTRPDQAERLRRQREAAAHDAWFRAEVEAGLAEAGRDEVITADEAYAAIEAAISAASR